MTMLYPNLWYNEVCYKGTALKFYLVIMLWPCPQYHIHVYNIMAHLVAQWLSGRVLDSRPRGHGFEPHQRHCVVFLSKTHLSLLSTGSTMEDLSQHNWKIVDWDVKNQIKQIMAHLILIVPLSGKYSKQPSQIGQTMIKLLLKKQSDQGLPCLLFWHPLC